MESARLVHGQAVYIFAFDVAHEMRRGDIAQVLGQPVTRFSLDPGKRNPRQLFFHRPWMARLPDVEAHGDLGPVTVQRSVKLLQVGAISVVFTVPFAVASVGELVAYHDFRLGAATLQDEARALVVRIRAELHEHYINPVEDLAYEEAYTVFCIDAETLGEAAQVGTREWHDRNRRAVAAVLTQEARPAELSEQEVEESTARWTSYYRHDLAVVDWDAALVIDRPANFGDTLYIMELANLQLAELEAYDRLLDGAVERAYRDIGGTLTRKRRRVIGELGELRIDLARLSDELSNITKFFGDWHLARLYQSVAERFHLSDWHASIDTKLRTLDGLYQLLKTDQNNRWMLLLEVTIVLLFVIDLVAILIPGGKG
jgi:hypothetical protein